MPRPKLPPRLYLRPARAQRRAQWVILDADLPSGERGTGTDRRGEADAALGRYLIEKSSQPPDSPQAPETLTVADVLTYYANEHAPSTAAPARIGYAIKRLAPFFGDLAVSAVKGNTCRRYLAVRARQGAGPATVRRELGTLRAALVHAETEGYLIAAPKVWLPEKPPSRDRWLTRSEAARLLWAARRTPHLARFILIALYTGTRRQAVLRLRWLPSTDGGHVDLDRGLLFRGSAERRRTAKRQTPCRIPRQLLGHMRRWRRITGEGSPVIGRDVASIKTSWRGAIRRSGIADAHPHDLKHTAVTWAMQRGGRLNSLANFFGTTADVLERVYGHHHPQFQDDAVRVMEER